MHTRGRIKQYNLGELLDAGVRVYRGAFVSFVLITALAVLPTMLLALAVIAVSTALSSGEALENSVEILDDLGPWFSLAGRVTGGQRSPSGLEQLLSFLITPIMQGALIHAASRRMVGVTISARPAYRVAFRRAWPLIGAELLSVLLVAVPAVPLLMCFMAVVLGMVVQSTISAFDPALGTAPPAFSNTPIVVAVLGLLVVLLPVLLFVFTRLAFYAQAAVLEKNGPWAAIKRSWRLTASSFWRVLGYVLAIGLLGSVIAIAIPLVLTLPLNLLFGDIQWLVQAVDAVADALAAIVVAPFTAIAYTLLYYDLRLREASTVVEGQRSHVEGSGRLTFDV